jgi:hypothetical protein
VSVTRSRCHAPVPINRSSDVLSSSFHTHSLTTADLKAKRVHVAGVCTTKLSVVFSGYNNWFCCFSQRESSFVSHRTANGSVN